VNGAAFANVVTNVAANLVAEWQAERLVERWVGWVGRWSCRIVIHVAPESVLAAAVTGCRKTRRHPGESRGPVLWAQYDQRLLDPGLRLGDGFSENFTFFDTLVNAWRMADSSASRTCVL
jgi:hypothetical protein